MKKPEILAPAGEIDSLKAAFAAGADAVYFGLPDFNARQRAENIKPELLPLIAAEAYLRGIKLYLTLNTLITEEEIPAVLEVIDRAMLAGIRAFIVQDPALIYILKKTWPEAEIHVSTQATTHSAGQIKFLSKCGVFRVNLARELSINEVRKLTEEAHIIGMETEVFVHGSYCISYSGQCYLCSFLEGCSGNRGLCQQNCRRVYRKNGISGYYLNLKDNSAMEFAPELVNIGVDSLKIEGRIKSPAYVYSTVKGWKGLTAAPESKKAQDHGAALFEGVFNREFTDSYLSDSVSSTMFSPSPRDFSIKECAEVLSYTADSFTLFTDSQIEGTTGTLEIIIKDSSGSFICAADAEEIEYSAGKAAYAYKIKITGKLDGKITRGCIVYSSRPALAAGEVKESIDSVQFRKIPVTAYIRAQAGDFFEMRLQGMGGESLYKSENLLEKSRKEKGSTREDFIKQLSRFGNTPFELKNTIFEKWEDGLFIPAGEVNTARRKCAAGLPGTIESPRKDLFLESYNYRTGTGTASGRVQKELTVYLNNLSAAENLFSQYGSSIDIMFEVTDPSISIPEYCIPVFPSVIDEEAENKYADYIRKSRHSLVVLNSTSLAEAVCGSGKEWIAGNYLNITNSLALKQLHAAGGCTGAIASLELSSQQTMALMEKSQLPVSMFIYSAVRLMTTRQCLLEPYRCGKKTSDKSCYYSSCGEESLDEIKGRRIRIIKRSWNYTELYDSSFISIPEAVSSFKGKASGFVIDLRDFSFAPHKTENISETAEAFKTYIENPDAKGKSIINNLFSNTSKGNIRKGLA